jgi:hypothetical protein
MGAQMVREVASKTNDIAGDGTTTATVLAQAIVQEGHKAVAAGMNPMDLKRGIDLAVTDVVAPPLQGRKKIKTSDEVAQVGTISANGESEIGQMIAEAMQKVGNEGVITVEEAKTAETELEVVEGMQFDRGYLSPYFVTNPDKMRRRAGRRLHPAAREEAVQPAGHAAGARVGRAVVQAAADHRRGCRGRGARHARRQQAAWRPQDCRRQGARLRRPPQGHAEDIAILTGGRSSPRISASSWRT